MLRRLLVWSLILWLGACSNASREDEADTLPVDQLYRVAQGSMENGNYDRAIRYYKRLTARFPFGEYTEQAQLDLAWSQYQRQDHDEAISTINRFIKTYPAHARIDYAFYLRGLINFDRNRSLIERYLPEQAGTRDQSFGRRSFNDFSELLRRYPNSQYAGDARQRMIFLRNDMAQYELGVARYYFRRGAYVASANRAKYLVENYQQATQVPDALALMAQSYEALGEPDLAADAKKVLAANAPDHPYLRGEASESGPGWLSRLWPF